jgi:cation:H+ antiporter
MWFLPDFLFSNYIYLVIGFIVLIKWADVLVTGASAIASRFGISQLVIGLTIVAFGTSAPELFVNVFSALKWQTELALWNVVGSNIANTWLVLWAAALVYPLQAKSSTLYKEVPFSLIASFALFFLAFDTFFSGGGENIIMRGDSLIFLLFFIIFFVYTFGLAKSGKSEATEILWGQSIGKSVSFVLLWLIGLGIWADFLVGSAKNIAVSFDVPESIIGLTIVAFGTSAPELVTSIVASLKRQSDIAIGNIVGSNIFNILLVLGLTWSIANLPVTDTLIIDICIELFAIVLLMVFLFFIGKRGLITRIEGAIFLWLYFIYIGYLVQTQLF